MAFLRHPLQWLSQNSNNSNPETMNLMLDLESDIIQESNKPVPGMWLFPKDPDACCIYRVPDCVRRVNPEAYTPQLVILGPLHHSLKFQSLKSRGDITSTNSMGYLNMEQHKKIYLAEFVRKVAERNIAIDGLRRKIEEDEEKIRASYSESTTWIPSQEFVDMILHDSVFILEFILRSFESSDSVLWETGDPLMHEVCLRKTIKRDLILLENQLPYFILQKLFDSIVPILHPNQTLRELVIEYFEFQGKMENNSRFYHFTDLFRLVRVHTIPRLSPSDTKRMAYIYNADKLDKRGIKFEVVKEFPMYMKFEKGCLKMPFLPVSDRVVITLRNIMALEQCHYPINAHVCYYVEFLDYLIDTREDVDLLVEKGIIQNMIGNHDLVAEMVNKLCVGIDTYGSKYYASIADDVNKIYANPVNKRWAFLKRVYFGNLWIGTATVAAMLLLLLTLIQTVASIIQVMQNASKKK